jgi:dihydroorotase-like cyclic amidohydrolase
MALTTDHSPFTLAEKERGLHDIWQAAIGAPGIEALTPVVMSEALGGRLTLTQAVKLLCSQPAKLFNLYPHKGTLQPGADADICLYDPQGRTQIDSSQWFSKAKVTDRLYHGRATQGKVAMTLVNGVPVYADGKIVGEPGMGRFVRPQME